MKIRHYMMSLCCCSVLQCVAVCCSMLQCVAVCCNVLQCVAEDKALHDESLPPCSLRQICKSVGSL